MNKLDMKGRTVIVTGGASGIGLAVVNRLSQSGANVAIWDLNEIAMAGIAKNITGVDVHTEKVDVANFANVEKAFESTKKIFPNIDGLVNCAGIAGENETVANYRVEEWLKVHNINLNGAFYTCKTLIPHMENNKYGRIVNIASIAGKEGNPNASAYSSSKAGVISLTKSIGKEVAKKGITVNCVTPAVVKTPILEQVSEQHIDYMVSKIPMGRLGLVEEIASMVCWLCTEDCSFTTGGVFDLSGGRATY
ncbi:MAG: 3-oxoacyl-ACP reductase [Proteobacteria bacterium]|nr:3-oxoacyl-ACP reductase [Pseudomonadota bacterium]